MRRPLVAALAALWNTCAQAQVFQGFPPVPLPLSGNELVPSDTGRTPPSAVITTRQLGQFTLGLDPGQNWLIAGDAAQNLWQRGTVGPVGGLNVVFGPDRWAYWGTSTDTVQVSQDLTPGVTNLGFGAAYKVQRTPGVTGVGQICFAQEVSTVNSVMLQGQFVEFDFAAYGGANLSATRVGIYLVTGTGVNEGVTKLAYGLNGGGGGSVGWTGQANAVQAAYGPLLVGGIVTPAVVIQLPQNETELAVVLCMTPTGTAGVQDWLDFSQLQLRQAPILGSYANASLPYVAPQLQVPPFLWRLGNAEALLQLSYYWQQTEGPGTEVVGGSCRVGSTPTAADCYLPFPVRMGRVPSMSYVAGFATDANSGGTTPCTTLAQSTGIGPTTSGAAVSCATGVNVKAANFLYDNGGTGIIRADAEWD